MAEAGAFDELAELEKMADEYSHFQKQDSEQAAELEKKIIELAHETKLDESIAYDETKPFTDYLAELHEYIEELQDSEIHVGLHVLGQPPEGDISCACPTDRCLPYIICGQKNSV